MPKFLIIQTAFIGDVVLATALIEKLHAYYPDAKIDFLLRKGNEGLLQGHPFINKLWIWNKKQHKQRNLLKIAFAVRKEGYTHVINVHRFATSGIITMLSGAKNRIGFDKNPLSFSFTKVIQHVIPSNPIHETDRNQLLITDLTGKDRTPAFPRLYPQVADYEKTGPLQLQPYICIAPSSVWFTKQFPVNKWIELIKVLPAQYQIYLLGGPGDASMCEEIIKGAGRANLSSLSGQLNFLQSAALMQGAVMNYTNDSAPLHFASAMEAPVTAVYCSTVPQFGFGPLRANGRYVEIAEQLYCRPCGLHGHKACPEGHFRCALEITNDQLLWWTSKTI